MTTASARGKDWVEVECIQCSSRYSCLVEAAGSASDTILPASGDALREAARYDLRKALQRKAVTIPCPNCGKFTDDYVDTKKRFVGRIVAWPSFFILVIVFFNVLAMISPEPETWIIVATIIGAFVACRILAAVAKRKVDPNRDLDANRRQAQQMVARGTIRIEGTQP
jgi:hypothetical protein